MVTIFTHFIKFPFLSQNKHSDFRIVFLAALLYIYIMRLLDKMLHYHHNKKKRKLSYVDCR